MKLASISERIRSAVVGTAVVAVILTALAGLAVVKWAAGIDTQERAQSLAALISSNAPAVLSLRDGERGRELLASIGASKQVASARLFDVSGTVIASYVRPGAALPTVNSNALNDSAHTAQSTVKFAEENLGTAEVTVDAALLSGVPILFLLSAIGVISLILLAVWIIARPLERIISRPLTNLSITTRRIRDTKDYKLRVPASSSREIRGLTDDFNAMLVEIEKKSLAQDDQSSKLSKLAFFDQLTGAANRSLFNDRLSHCIDDFLRNHRAFAVIGIDLDHFKQLNDSLGHNIGDNYLREATARCQQSLRPSDTFARMGGDEFIALIPGVEKIEDAMLIAEKIAKAVIQANSIHTAAVKCTASIGVGMYPIDAQNATELLAKVDAAMYRAKSNGRNQIVSVSAPSTGIARPQPPSLKLFG